MTIYTSPQRSRFTERRFSNENGNMIRGTFAVVLAIILLIISVSGFFILLVSDCNNIFYLTPVQQRLTEFSTENNSFIYQITLCQLTLIIAEVVCSLVIIFSNSNQAVPVNYNIVPSTSRDFKTREVALVNCRANKCSYIFSLKLTFTFLVFLSFCLRLVTSTWSSLVALAPPNHLPTLAYLSSAVITGATNFSGIIYMTSILEVLLFFTVISTSTQTSSTRRVVSASDNR